MKRIATSWRAGIILSLATAAMTGTALTHAGPGCMNGGKQHMARGYHPYSPMGPQPAYGQPAPYGHSATAANYMAPAPAMGRMAPRYNQPMMAQRGYPGVVSQPATPAQAKTSPVQPTKVAASVQNKPAGDNVTVRINGMQFQPARLTVKPGTTVTWIQDSRMPHAVSGDADGPRSPTLYSGQKFSHTFDAAGSYNYVCDFHPSMKGSVIVVEDGVGT